MITGVASREPESDVDSGKAAGVPPGTVGNSPP